MMKKSIQCSVEDEDKEIFVQEAKGVFMKQSAKWFFLKGRGSLMMKKRTLMLR